MPSAINDRDQQEKELKIKRANLIILRRRHEPCSTVDFETQTNCNKLHYIR